jgi:hypothetical protein
MMQDEDPKFRNSKFLQFLKQLSDGKLKIEGNELKQGDLEVSEEVFQ